MERKPVVQQPSTFAIRPLVGVAIQLVAGWSGGFRGKNCRRSVDTWPGRGGKLVDRRKNGWKKGGGVGHGLTLYLVATLHIPSGRPVKSTGRIDLSFLYTHTRIYIYIIFFLFFSFTFHDVPRGKSRRIANTDGQSVDQTNAAPHKAFYIGVYALGRNSFSNLSIVRDRSRRERFFLWTVCRRRVVC